MALSTAIIKLNLELWERGFYKKIRSVVDMGAQDILLSQADFDELTKRAGITNYKREDFANFKNWPGRPRCSAKPFYELLGVKEYSCVDLGGEYNAIKLDLNYPFEDKSRYGLYDLVTDYGNNEHVFNTAEAYRTMHRLCKKGGILIISQAIYHGNGYYSYEPSFFEGMAAANNYRIRYSSYIVDLKTATASGSPNQFHIPLSSELLDATDWAKIKGIGICYVMQKESDEDFRYPYQDKYMSHVYGNEGYLLQFTPTPPSRSYVPICNGPEEAIPGKALLKQLVKRILKRIKVF